MSAQQQRESYVNNKETTLKLSASRNRFFERLIVTYFSFIGLFLFFTLVVLQTLHLFPSNILTPFLFAGIYLPVAYLLLRKWSTAVIVVTCALLSWFLFSIIFVFTYFIWLIFGLLCLVYAFATGLFTDEKDNVGQVEVGNMPVKQYRFFVSRPILGLLLLLLLFYGTVHVALYGLSFDRCQYTTREHTIPIELQNVLITTERDAYVAGGQESMNCAPLLKDISLQLVNARTLIDNPETYYAERGMSFEPLPHGKTFKVQNYVGLQKKGLLFSGFGDRRDYLTLLIITDERGSKYTLKKTELGLNAGDLFLSFTPNNKEHPEWLSYIFFDNNMEENAE